MQKLKCLGRRKHEFKCSFRKKRLNYTVSRWHIKRNLIVRANKVLTHFTHVSLKHVYSDHISALTWTKFKLGGQAGSTTPNCSGWVLQYLSFLPQLEGNCQAHLSWEREMSWRHWTEGCWYSERCLCHDQQNRRNGKPRKDLVVSLRKAKQSRLNIVLRRNTILNRAQSCSMQCYR